MESAVDEGDVRNRYRSFDGMADSTTRAGLPDEALRFRTEIVRMALAEPDAAGIAYAYLRRAETRFEAGAGAARDLERARTAVAEIKDAADRRLQEANLLLVQGRILGASRPADALPLLSQVVETYEATGDRFRIIDAYLLRAKAGLAVADPAGAEKDLRAGLGEFERQRDKVKDENLRLTYFEQARELFDHLIALQARRPDGTAAAFDVAERQRARVLLDRLAPERLAQPLTLREVRRRLPPGVVLVAYTSLPDRLLVWTARRDAAPDDRGPGHGAGAGRPSGRAARRGGRAGKG
jgi:hypothetical protein